MIKRLKAIFDGDVLRPIEPLDLEPNTDADSSFLDVAENLKLNGPADWSANVDKYLYGRVDIPDG